MGVFTIGGISHLHGVLINEPLGNKLLNAAFTSEGVEDHGPHAYRCWQGHGQASYMSLWLPFLFHLLGSPLLSHLDMHTVYVITWPDVPHCVHAPTPAALSTASIPFKIWHFLITGLNFYDKSCNFPPCVNIWAHSKTGWMLCWYWIAEKIQITITPCLKFSYHFFII